MASIRIILVLHTIIILVIAVCVLLLGYYLFRRAIREKTAQINTLVKDISARKEAELVLKESEEMLKFAAIAGKIGLWDYNSTTGKSTVLYDFSGIKYPGGLINLDFLQLIYEEDKAMVITAFNDYISGKTEEFEVLCRIKTIDPVWQWTLASGLVLERNSDGKALRVAGYIRNFTSQKRAQEELMNAKSAAEAASRAKGDFIANMSHEIRTPLNAILGLTRLLTDTGLNSKQNDYLQKIQYSADSLLTIVNDILDFSKYDSQPLILQKAPFDLISLVNKAVNILENNIISKGLNLELSISEDVPSYCIGDPSRLRQVLLNIIGNAVKFTENGSVSVKVMIVDTSSDKVLIKFIVEDTGIGIKHEQLSNLFKPFSQGDPSISKIYGGTGLGLVISKNLIENMGGKIEVESQPGQGSKFTFIIELIPTEAPVPGKSEFLSPKPSYKYSPTGASRILVVDDNEINLMVVEEFLRNAGHITTRASSGQEALDKLQEQPFDMVLLDLHMPVIDGLQTSRRITSLQLAEKPVIMVLTANTDEAARKEALAAGVDDYLTKPFDPEQLLETIAKWIPENKSTGLDVSSVLKRLNGDYFLFISILELFIENNKCFIDSLNTALVENKASDAILLCHTLKGVSGNIGALALSETADAAVKELLASVKGELSPMVHSLLEKQFKTAFSSASALVQKYKSENNQIIYTDTLSVDLELNALISLCEKNDLAAWERFRKIEPILLQSFDSEILQDLRSKLSGMDWKAGLELLGTMRHSLV